MMNLRILSLFVLFALTRSEEVPKDKRGIRERYVASPNQHYVAAAATHQQAYARRPQPAQKQEEENYGGSEQQQYHAQGVRYTAVPVAYNPGAYQHPAQAVAYAQAANPKSASVQAHQKETTYQQVQPAQAQHYSFANDVSSFSYSSPVVQYNSLGQLTLQAGKAPQQEQEVTYSQQARAQPKVQYVQVRPQKVHQAQQKVQYVPQYESYPQPEQKEVSAKAQVQQQKYVLSSQEYEPQNVQYITVPQGSQHEGQQQQYSRAQLQQYQAQHQQAAQSAPEQQVIYAQIPQQYLQQYYQSLQQQQQGSAKAGIQYA